MNIILQKVRETVQKDNKDYDILIKWLYLYYDMKLVTFGIDDKRNLIVQFPVFVHPQSQQHLTLYQLETVLVPILDRNKNAQSYTPSTGYKTIHSFKFRNLYFIKNSRVRSL